MWVIRGSHVNTHRCFLRERTMFRLVCHTISYVNPSCITQAQINTLSILFVTRARNIQSTHPIYVDRVSTNIPRSHMAHKQVPKTPESSATPRGARIYVNRLIKVSYSLHRPTIPDHTARPLQAPTSRDLTCRGCLLPQTAYKNPPALDPIPTPSSLCHYGFDLM